MAEAEAESAAATRSVYEAIRNSASSREIPGVTLLRSILLMLSLAFWTGAPALAQDSPGAGQDSPAVVQEPAGQPGAPAGNAAPPAPAEAAPAVPPPAAPPFPDGKPVTLLVPFPPGTPADRLMRLLAPAVAEDLRTEVTIVNEPGSWGEIGWSAAARARPDGYTVAYTRVPSIIIVYADRRRKARFTRADFVPVAQIATERYLLAVPAASPYQSFADFLAAARAKPRGVMLGDSGLLSDDHMVTPRLEKVAGVTFDTIHFIDGKLARKALAGDFIDGEFATARDLLPLVSAGQVRLLASASADPDPAAPQVPTMRALGTDLVQYAADGVMVPRGTPPEIVARIAAAFRAAVTSQEMLATLRQEGFSPEFADGAALGDAWAEQDPAIGPMINVLAK
jgi:tripartite-type tricarboxylate transporter receptor subunit TctC